MASTTTIPLDYSLQSPTEQTQTVDQTLQTVTDPTATLSPDAIQTSTALDTGDIAGGSQFQQESTTSPAMIGDTQDAQAFLGTTQEAGVGTATASTYDPSLIGDAPQSTAAQGDVTYSIDPATGEITHEAEGAIGTVSAADLMTAAQGTIGTAGVADAATRDLEKNALITTQMDELLNELEGGNIPDWAQPAVNQVEASLAARGMSTSSVGRDALFSAIIQAATPLAQSNAEAYQQRYAQNLTNEQQTALFNAQNQVGMDMQNLSNQQQAALSNSQFMQTMSLTNLSNQQQAAMQNAVSWATMDQQNLNNAQQALVENAKNYLQMDLSNLSNEQQSSVMNMQARLQTLTSDQAAGNAAKQFNAQSQTQVDSLMAQLATNVSLQNAAQYNAMSQANATVQTQVSQFNSQVDFNREQFNSQMYAQIEQSNVNWRRQMNTIDTAGENAVNQANAINAFNLSNQAMTWLWGDMRDAATWSFQAAENDQEKNLRLALAALANEQAASTIQTSSNTEFWKTVGGFVSALF